LWWNPDQVADFTAMPFADETFSLVVFDPPHVQRKEALGILTRRYGHLTGDWREMLRKGFSECFRVLKPNGVLVFKWAESQFRVAEILKLTPAKPLFGHHTSKTTHWAVFIKAWTRGSRCVGLRCCTAYRHSFHNERYFKGEIKCKSKAIPPSSNPRTKPPARPR
jgi:SAM-dependent methyltransferase